MLGQLLTKNAKVREVGNQCRDRNVFQGFFSTAERRADMASLDYAGSFGDSLVSMPQPDSISGRVESVLVGPSASLMLALPQHLTHPFEMVDSHFLDAGRLAKS
jgi:hypothetical protein